MRLHLFVNGSSTLASVAGSVRVTSTTRSSVVFDSNGVPSTIADPDGTVGFGFVANDAQLTQNTPFSIVDPANGNVVSTGRWGVWDGAFQATVAGQSVSPTGDFHVAIADRFTTADQLAALPNVSFSYNHTGGIATNEVGSLVSPLTNPVSGTGPYSVRVNGVFTDGVTLGSMVVVVKASFVNSSFNWTLSGGGTVADFIARDGIPIVGNCTLCNGGLIGIRKASGVFLGPSAQGVITSFSATDGINSSIAGTAVNVQQ